MRQERTEPSRGRRWGIRLIAACAVAVLIGYVPFWWFGSADARRVAALRSQLSEIRDKARVVAAANARLRGEIFALESDPRAIEDVARETLGLVRPGELVIRFETDSGGSQGRRGLTP